MTTEPTGPHRETAEDAIDAIERSDKAGMYAQPWTEELDEHGELWQTFIDSVDRHYDQRLREANPYDFFRTERARKELFEYCEKLAEYLHDQNIADIVLVDRAARPVWIGLKEYWRAKYPNIPMPGIYFLNPKGFRTVENTTPWQEDEIRYKSMSKDELVEWGTNKTTLMVTSELREVYKHLLEDKEKPVVVFDSCLHEGETMQPVIETLKLVGFQDLRVVVVNPDYLSPSSPVQPDYFLTQERSSKPCYPFDEDRLVEKTYNHVYSLPTNDPERLQKASELRAEIRKIVREYLARQ